MARARGRGPGGAGGAAAALPRSPIPDPRPSVVARTGESRPPNVLVVLEERKPVVARRGGTVVEQAFDLRTDPGETEPLIPGDAAPFPALRKCLEEAAGIQRSAPGPGRSDLSPETRRALEGLGYAGRDPDGPR